MIPLVVWISGITKSQRQISQKQNSLFPSAHSIFSSPRLNIFFWIWIDLFSIANSQWPKNILPLLSIFFIFLYRYPKCQFFVNGFQAFSCQKRFRVPQKKSFNVPVFFGRDIFDFKELKRVIQKKLVESINDKFCFFCLHNWGETGVLLCLR